MAFAASLEIGLPSPVSIIARLMAMMPTAAQIQNWLDQKDSWGPAYTGGPGWKKFMAMLHAEIEVEEHGGGRRSE